MSSSAETRTKNDAICCVLIAPPNYSIKMKVSIDLVTSDRNHSREIARQIEADGQSVNPVWEEYLT